MSVLKCTHTFNLCLDNDLSDKIFNLCPAATGHNSFHGKNTITGGYGTDVNRTIVEVVSEYYTPVVDFDAFVMILNQ